VNADFLNQAFQVIRDMMTTNADFFVGFGLRLYQAFTLIIIAWFGIRVALSGDFSAYQFARLMLVISFGLAMTKYYAAPIPGFGYSFYELFTKQGDYLALQLNQDMLTQIKSKLDWIWEAIQYPTINLLLAPVDLLRWGAVSALILMCYLATTWVTLFGFIASAVCVLLGPVFIPFFIVPDMEWLFWGWLRALIQYAFYQVVANAFVFVFGTLLIQFVDNSSVDFTSMNLAPIVLPTVIVLGTFCFAIMKIPSVVNSLFTGRSGESAYIPIPGLGLR
jgi:type IV secretory pathway VirB6-like protein